MSSDKHNSVSSSQYTGDSSNVQEASHATGGKKVIEIAIPSEDLKLLMERSSGSYKKRRATNQKPEVDGKSIDSAR
ncbi:hypothetical protein CERZMDRAFT_91818 [Cercospora zeae-maydis SCOH1-5]|uniref:Uncharacterized protein n=1 Tax=Cercospora zeae-maydis SCOH1-5 TaxID=717836 RepID=A0A6A6EYH8_9PEZI|nr:hypothetical protein CERZMDRAFT_91818 [Cercospora zeae-maydis SCOH1-5]